MKQNLTKKQLRNNILKDLKDVSSKGRAIGSQRFFKTGKGEYGQGDVFVGIRTPQIRKISKKYLNDLDLADLDFFLHSKIHEYRLFAVITLTYIYGKTEKIKDTPKKEQIQEKIFNYYLKNRKWVNNWDLVDLSAPKIVGAFLLNKERNVSKEKRKGKERRKEKKERKVLYDLIKSNNLWDKRIAIVSTYTFIKQGDFNDISKISKLVINDNDHDDENNKHDLIQKALGWMLREVGKKDETVLKTFLDEYATKMPRTTLRYSIERFDKKERKRYLNMKMSKEMY
jgi:3-methyladenine DNA glycosylase AlkD